MAVRRRGRWLARWSLRRLVGVQLLTAPSSRGLVHGIAAYSLWGLFPLYWKLLTHVPALEVLAHRIVWSCVLLLLLVEWRRRSRHAVAAGVAAGGGHLRRGCRPDRRQLVPVRLGRRPRPGARRPASATSSRRSSACCSAWSMLRERLRPLQWAAVAMAALGHGVSGAFASAASRGCPSGLASQLRQLRHREEAGALVGRRRA